MLGMRLLEATPILKEKRLSVELVKRIVEFRETTELLDEHRPKVVR